MKQKNPMATIHQVLSRLVESEAVTVSAHEPGRNRYKWGADILNALGASEVEKREDRVIDNSPKRK
jgi:hypothetical protein